MNDELYIVHRSSLPSPRTSAAIGPLERLALERIVVKEEAEPVTLSLLHRRSIDRALERLVLFSRRHAQHGVILRADEPRLHPGSPERSRRQVHAIDHDPRPTWTDDHRPRTVPINPDRPVAGAVHREASRVRSSLDLDVDVV